MSSTQFCSFLWLIAVSSDFCQTNALFSFIVITSQDRHHNLLFVDMREIIFVIIIHQKLLQSGWSFTHQHFRCLALSTLGSCNLSLKSKLQNLQNRAVRIVSKDYSSPVEEVFTNLKLLNVQQLIDFDTATLIYKSQYNLTPQYISDMFVPSGIVHGHNTRHTVNGLFIPHFKSTYGSRCFAQIGSRLWNNLPNDFQTARSVDTFKSGF